MVVVFLDNKPCGIPYGDYRVGNNTYVVNSMGIFRVNNFESTKIYNSNKVSTDESLIIDIELKGLYRTIKK